MPTTIAKTSKRRLTGLRKRRRGAVTPLANVDGLWDSLETLGALATLLEAVGKSSDPSGLWAEEMTWAVGHAGTLMLAEVERARSWVNALEAAL